MICFPFFSVRLNRSGRGGDRSIAKDTDGHKPLRVRDLQQRVPEGPEPAAPPARPQPAVEAEAEGEDRDPEEEGVHMSRDGLRAP